MLHGAPKQPRGSAASSAVSHSLDDWLCGRSGGAGSGGKPDKAGASLYSCDLMRTRTGFGECRGARLAQAVSRAVM